LFYPLKKFLLRRSRLFKSGFLLLFAFTLMPLFFLNNLFPAEIPLLLLALFLLAEILQEYRPSRPAKWLRRMLAAVYGLYFTAFLGLLLRCFIPATGFIGPLLVLLVVAACAWRRLPIRLTALLVFNAAMVIAAGLYAYPQFAARYLPAPKPAYQTEVLTFDHRPPVCENVNVSPADFQFAPRQLHFYGDTMTLTNGYKRSGLYLNGLATAWPPRGNAKCLIADYLGDLIRDPDTDRYYTVNYHFREVWLLDANLRLLKKSKQFFGQILDLFLLPDGKGGRRLYVVSEGGVHIYQLNPDTLEMLEYAAPFVTIQMDTVIDARRNALYGATFGPWLAVRFNLDNPLYYRRAALGIGSWGLDRDPLKNELYVSDFFLGRITKVDAQSMAVLRSRTFWPGWRSVVFDPQRRLVYVGNYFFPRVLVLDENLKQRAVLQTHGAVRNLVLSADQNTLYVACLGGLFAIDLDLAVQTEGR
jgi:hypothetical protein